jgi:acyl-CoA reductase-like NAD-dependent aldehyde dehydrogenase
MWEEMFGSIISVVRVEDVNEAIDLANKCGLDSCVFTTNLNLTRRDDPNENDCLQLEACKSLGRSDE